MRPGVNAVKVVEGASKQRFEVKSRKNKTSELIVPDLILNLTFVIRTHVQVLFQSIHMKITENFNLDQINLKVNHFIKKSGSKLHMARLEQLEHLQC